MKRKDAIDAVRKRYAKRLNAARNKTVAGIFEMSIVLRRARAKLPRGQWAKFLRDDVGFNINARSAQMMMAIAGDQRLRKANRGSLPPSWRTLYELTRLTDEEFAKIELTPDLRRQDVTDVRRRPRPEPGHPDWNDRPPVKKSLGRPHEERKPIWRVVASLVIDYNTIRDCQELEPVALAIHVAALRYGWLREHQPHFTDPQIPDLIEQAIVGLEEWRSEAATDAAEDEAA